MTLAALKICQTLPVVQNSLPKVSGQEPSPVKTRNFKRPHLGFPQSEFWSQPGLPAKAGDPDQENTLQAVLLVVHVRSVWWNREGIPGMSNVERPERTFWSPPSHTHTHTHLPSLLADNVSWWKNTVGHKGCFFVLLQQTASLCCCFRDPSSPRQQCQTAHTVSTAAMTWEGRSSFAMKASQCASAATPSSAPTPVPSAIGPFLWSQRYKSVGLFPFLAAPLTCNSGHQELHHKGRYWHEECFRCTKCYKNLAKEPFNTKDERIMCGKCCSKEDAPRCHGCYKPLLAGMSNCFIGKSKRVFFLP